MNVSPTPTRAAIVTPIGKGAVSCLAVDGPQAVAAVESQFRSASGRFLSEQPFERILYGTWAMTGEEVIVVRRSESNVEVHCHGGMAAARTILDALAAAGCVTVRWQELAVHQEVTPIRAAARVALAACATQRTARIILDQYKGALDAAIERVIQSLTAGEGATAVAKLKELTAWANLGRHLATPWRVVIAGPPNVGKSTLINALVGYERAIVFDQPGTTRDVVTAATAIEGWPIELTDTAGLRSSGDTIEQIGRARASEALQTADLAIMVFDITQPWLPEYDGLLDQHGKRLVVHNKCDLLSGATTAQRSSDRPDGLLASAKTGVNLPVLCERIASDLVPRLPAPGAAIPFTAEQIEAIQSSTAHAEAGQLSHAAADLARLVPAAGR